MYKCKDFSGIREFEVRQLMNGAFEVRHCTGKILLLGTYNYDTDVVTVEWICNNRELDELQRIHQ